MDFNDRIGVTKPEIVGVVGTKLAKGIRSTHIFTEGHLVARKVREGNGGRGLAFLINDNLMFQEILVDDT